MIQPGFVGVGTMGAPMVHCLARNGYPVCLFDTSAAALQVAAQRDNLPVADSLADLGARSELVFLMLPNSAIVRTVCLATGGLAANMAHGSIIVDMSSSDPIETRKLGTELSGSGITLLDAPVSGGVAKARAGTLAIIMGGDDDAAMNQVTPVLESMGTVYRAGALAAGHATKALNNYVSASGLAAACEALIIGREFGLDPARMTEIINASTGRNNSTENKIAQFVLSEDFKSAGFSLGLMAKDIGLAAGLAQSVGKPLPGVALAAETWQKARDALDTDADHTEIYRYLNADQTPR